MVVVAMGLPQEVMVPSLPMEAELRPHHPLPLTRPSNRPMGDIRHHLRKEAIAKVLRSTRLHHQALMELLLLKLVSI